MPSEQEEEASDTTIAKNNEEEVHCEEENGRPFRLTVEVPLFLVFIGFSLSATVISNLNLYRTCTQALGYAPANCSQLIHGNKSDESKALEAEVQKVATIINMVKSVLEGIVPAILSLFLGVWSDTYGRKPLILWPLFGLSVSSLLLVGYSLLPSLGPWYLLLISIPTSLCGGFSSLFTGVFCYVTDVTSTANRSFRLALLEASFFSGVVLGYMASPYAVAHLKDTYILLVTFLVHLLASLFTLFFVSESLQGALKGGFSKIFNVGAVREMCRTCFKRRDGFLRPALLILVGANCVIIFIVYALFDVDYFYTRRKLHWELPDYNVYSAVNTILAVSGLVCGVTVLQKLLRLSDVSLVILAVFSNIVNMLIKCFATLSWHMYLGLGISLFRDLATPLNRSMVSKLAPAQDIAKLFALMAALEAIAPVLAPVLYDSLYAVTIDTFPGAVYLLSAGLLLCVLVGVTAVKFMIPTTGTVDYARL